MAGHECLVLEGTAFWEGAWKLENGVQEATMQYLKEAGEKLPKTFENLGTVLSLIDRLASCHWGCKGGDHVFEYLAGRVSNTSLAAVRLIRSGAYDEAFVLIRSLGEIANLLALFIADPNECERWLQTPPEDQWKDFGPAAVRNAIKKAGMEPPVSHEEYKQLCGLFTHVTSATVPQKHNVLGKPVACPKFQDGACLASVNELSSMVWFCAMALSKIIGPDEEVHATIWKAANKLQSEMGAFGLRTNMEVNATFQREIAKAKAKSVDK